MPKIHTRFKRKHGLPTHQGPYKALSRVKRPGPRTFKTEEGAREWASKKGLGEGKYILKKAKKGKKFQIVTEKELAKFGFIDNCVS